MMNIIDAVKNFDGQRNRCRNLYLAFGIGAVAILALMGLTGIKFAFIIIPLILIVLGYFVYAKKFKLDEEYYALIVAELKERGDVSE